MRTLVPSFHAGGSSGTSPLKVRSVFIGRMGEDDGTSQRKGKGKASGEEGVKESPIIKEKHECGTEVEGCEES